MYVLNSGTYFGSRCYESAGAEDVSSGTEDVSSGTEDVSAGVGTEQVPGIPPAMVTGSSSPSASDEQAPRAASSRKVRREAALQRRSARPRFGPDTFRP